MSILRNGGLPLVALLGALSAAPGAAQAQTVDGTRDAGYPAALAVQANATGFGNATLGQTGKANGSELDNIHAQIVGSDLFIFIGGNLETNGNKLEIFVDSKAGGQNTLASGGAGPLANQTGLTFDAGFGADYLLSVGAFESGGAFGGVYVDYATVGGAAGSAGTNNTAAASQPLDFDLGPGTLAGEIGFNNANTGGVGGFDGMNPTGNVGNPGAVNTGIELRIPLSALGTSNNNGPLKLCVFVNGDNHNYASNQVLAPLPAGTGNPGGDGSGNFTGTLGGVNFSARAGNQFVTVANGTAPAAPAIGVNPTSLNFFNVFVTGSTAQRTFAVTNTGGGTLTVSNIASSNAAFSVTPTTATLASGGSATVTVTFDPSAAGTASGTITVTSDAAVSPNPTVAVSGRGVTNGQVLLDGTLDSGGLYAVKALQTTPTGFGDNQSELNGAYARVDGSDLYLTLTGNLEANGNKLALFFDANPATGQNTYLASNATIDNGSSAALAGLTFDRGFRPERMLAINLGGTSAYASLVPLDGGTASTYLSTTGNAFTQDLTFGPGVVGELSVNNANTAGVSGTSPGNPGTVGNPGAVQTGLELRIPLSALGYTAGAPLHVAAFIASGGYDYLSNQVLGGLPLGTGNLGADGAGNGGATVSVNFNNFAGNQYFTVQSADLNIATDVTQAGGIYNNVTVQPGGILRLGADLGVSGALTVQNGGSLLTFVTAPAFSCNNVVGSGSFALNAGGSLAVCAAGGIPASGNAGNIQVAGSRNLSTGASYLYFGSAAQSTGAGLPATVAGLGQSNPLGLTLTQPVTVTNTLVFTAGAGNLTTGGQALTLASNAAGTALVANLGSGTVVGNATVQRYIDPSVNGGEGYRHYSAPVSNTTLADLATPGGFAPVLTTGYNSAAIPGATRPFPNVFAYDETRVLTSPATALDDFSKGWFVPTGSMEVGRGYTVRIPAPQTVDFVGSLNNGTQTPLALTRSAAAGGWALVGNPYPAPLNYGNVLATDRSGLDAAVYVFSSSSAYGGSYRSYTNGVGGNPIIPSGQGFFVRVSGSTGSLTFRNSQRETTANATAFQRGAADVRPQVQLALATAGQPTDLAYLYFQTGATAGVDGEFDAVKLPNIGTPGLATVAAGTELAINGLPALAAGLTVPLTLRATAAGTYALSAAALLNLPAGLPVYLTDARTGRHTLLSGTAAYTFGLTAAEVAAPVAGRFALHFGPLAAPLAATSGLSAASLGLYPNPAHASATLLVPAVAGASSARATLYNALGQPVRTFAPAALPAEGLSTTLNLAGIAPGLYTLRVQAGAASAARKLVVE